VLCFASLHQVGIIMYLPTIDDDQRAAITKSFFEYRKATQQQLWDSFSAFEHWAKIEVQSWDPSFLFSSVLRSVCLKEKHWILLDPFGYCSSQQLPVWWNNHYSYSWLLLSCGGILGPSRHRIIVMGARKTQEAISCGIIPTGPCRAGSKQHSCQRCHWSSLSSPSFHWSIVMKPFDPIQTRSRITASSLRMLFRSFQWSLYLCREAEACVC